MDKNKLDCSNDPSVTPLGSKIHNKKTVSTEIKYTSTTAGEGVEKTRVERSGTLNILGGATIGNAEFNNYDLSSLDLKIRIDSGSIKHGKKGKNTDDMSGRTFRYEGTSKKGSFKGDKGEVEITTITLVRGKWSIELKNGNLKFKRRKLLSKKMLFAIGAVSVTTALILNTPGEDDISSKKTEGFLPELSIDKITEYIKDINIDTLLEPLEKYIPEKGEGEGDKDEEAPEEINQENYIIKKGDTLYSLFTSKGISPQFKHVLSGKELKILPLNGEVQKIGDGMYRISYGGQAYNNY